MTETDYHTARTWIERMDKEQMAIERLKAVSEMSLAVYGLALVVITSSGKDNE